MSANYGRNHPSALDVSFGDSPPAEGAECRQNKRGIDTVSFDLPSFGGELELFQPEPNTAQSNLPPSRFSI